MKEITWNDIAEKNLSAELADPEQEKERTAALKSAMKMLAYADNPEKRLREKLRRKGYGEEAVEYALMTVIREGYLDENRQIAARIAYLAEKKLYGRSRIRMELVREGFCREAIREAEQSGLLDEIDYEENCARMLDKYGTDDFRKATAYLSRCGYTISEIKRAWNEAVK